MVDLFYGNVSEHATELTEYGNTLYVTVCSCIVYIYMSQCVHTAPVLLITLLFEAVKYMVYFLIMVE